MAVLAAAALGVALLTPVAASQAATEPVRLRVAGVLESVPREVPGQAGMDTTLTLDGDMGRLVVRRTPRMPTTGRVQATVLLPATVAPDLAGRSVAAATTDGRALVAALETQPVRLDDATYDVGAAAGGPSRHRFHLAVPTNLGDFGAMTDAALVDLLQRAGAYWTTEADGMITGVDVGAPQRFVSTAAAASAGCGLLSSEDVDRVWDEAGALFPGVDFASGGEHLIVALPDECASGFVLGLGTLNDSLADGGKVLFHAELASALTTLVHELGHNVGLMHAGASSCSPTNLDYCPGGGYEDLYDPMGYGFGSAPTALNSAHRDDLGILASGEQRTVTLPDGESSVTAAARIVPRSQGSGLRTVVVVDPETSDTYYVDYRSGTGRDAGGAYASGYRFLETTYLPGVTVVQTSDDNSSTLWTRWVSLNDRYGARQTGEVFTNRSGSVSVQVVSVDAGQHADVSVTLRSDRATFVSPPTPVITGVPEVGETLRVDAGAWPDGTVLDVRWFVEGFGEEAPLDSQDELFVYSNYRGAQVVAEVRASRDDLRTVVRRSLPVGPVTYPVGVSVRIQSSSGLRVGSPVISSITTSPESASRSLQWLADGVEIPGATGETYTPVEADIGRLLSLRVVAEAPHRDPEQKVSNIIGPVPGTSAGPPPPSATVTPSAGPAPAPVTTGPAPEELDQAPATLRSPRPTIRGEARVGARLTARLGRWTPGTRLRIQWLANGRVVRGATRASYVVPRTARGKRLSVRVTGTKVGYARATVTSRPTRRVR